MKRPSSSPSRTRRGPTSKRAGIALFAVTSAFILIASACSNQGEGERCEILNGNDDCRTEDGLVCYPSNQLRNTTSDRCCPADRSRATHPVCKTSVDTGSGDALAPPDTGTTTPETGTPDDDAGSDASDGGEGDADAADQ